MAQADYLKCAVCSVTYGVRTGDQPPGSMTYKLEPFACAGYPKTQTWTIRYEFDDGKRNGKKFSGD